MALKGCTRIELTNVNTGEKTVHEEHNMITNAFDYFAQGFGAFGGAVYQQPFMGNGDVTNIPSGANFRTNPLRFMTNGLILLNKSLPEDKDHVYITPEDDVRIVGCGMDGQYTGAQPEAGTYNKQESGEIENGYKHVWDFATNQANGKIACACLTTPHSAGHGSLVGFPTLNDDWYGGFQPIMGSGSFHHICCEDAFTDSWDASKLMYIDEANNRMVRVKNIYSLYASSTATTGNVTNEHDDQGRCINRNVFTDTFLSKKYIELEVYRFPYSEVSIFDKLNEFKTEERYYQNNYAKTTYEYPSFKLLETVKVEIPAEIKTILTQHADKLVTDTEWRWAVSANMSEKYLNIIFSVPSTAGSGAQIKIEKNEENIHLWRIDMQTFESTYVSIKNTTNEVILRDMFSGYCVYEGAYGRRIHAYATDEYIVIPQQCENSCFKFFVINIKDNADVKLVKDLEGNDFLTNWNCYTFFDFGGYIFCNNDGAAFRFGLANGKASIINSRTYNVFFYKNDNYGRWRVQGTTHNTKIPKVLKCHSSRGVEMVMMPDFLTTINNLGSEVQKTAETTMKVTYTITDEVPEEETK